eukprot:6037268-Alexandrium_andersonii.AAC.1
MVCRSCRSRVGLLAWTTPGLTTPAIRMRIEGWSAELACAMRRACFGEGCAHLAETSVARSLGE